MSDQVADVHSDAVAAYERAKERADLIFAAWVEAGRPVLAEGGATGRAPVSHPLLKSMNEADALVDRLRDRVRVAHRGPVPSAVLRGSAVPKSRGARLRAVGDDGG